MLQKRTILIIIQIFCLFLWLEGTSGAGGYHRSDQSSLHCSDCHTAHYSEGGTVPSDWGQAGPYRLLLKKDMINDLCMMCHDGTDSAAPNVKNPSYKSSAGAFNPTGEINESHRHSLGSTVAPPGYEGSWDPNTPLTCASCHNPHGNDYYRNLKHDPGNATSITVTYMIGGTYDNNSAIQQIASTPLSTRYSVGNIKYRQTYKATDNYGLSRWCGGCHGNFHGEGGALNMGGSPAGDTGSSAWIRHPTRDVTMQEGETNGHASLSHWASSLSSRIPVVSPDNTLGNGDDQVFCGSCHKAHGSGHCHNLIWDDEDTEAFEDGSRLSNTCQQCHYK